VDIHTHRFFQARNTLPADMNVHPANRLEKPAGFAVIFVYFQVNLLIYVI